MKPIHAIIAASLILNVVLFVCAKPFAPRARPPVVSVKTQPRKSDAQSATAFNLKTATPEQLAQKLAAMDFPPDIIKAVVMSRIERIWDNKRESAWGEDDLRYWRRPQFDRAKYGEYLTALRERNEAVEKLFAADGIDPKQMQELRQRYGDLSDEKLRAINKIEGDYGKQHMTLYEKYYKSGTPFTEEDRKQQESNRRERRDALAKLLTSDELREYNLRVSNASSYASYETRMFDVTEQEFRGMFAVYQKLYTYDDPDAPKEFKTQQERDAYKKEQLREILGAERYADFVQSNTSEHQNLNVLVHRLDLPLSAAREVVSVRDDIRTRAAAIDTDASLTNPERAELYKSLAQEAKTRITQTLGDRGYTAYRESSKNWIQTLESGRTPTLPRQ